MPSTISGRHVRWRREIWCALDADEALLVRWEEVTYLLYEGKRAQVDPADSVIARSLRLDEHSARSISAALLNAATQVAPLTAPVIPQVGEPGPGRLAAVPVGGVVRVPGVHADADRLYVVLADGVQPISAFAAEVIRNANSQGMSEITELPPDQLVGMPVVHQLPLDDFPRETPRILSAEEAPVGCLSWSRPVHVQVATVIVAAGRDLPLPENAKPVPLASADGVGDRVDAAYLPPGTGEYVQATGMEPASTRPGTLFYIADNGIRYGVPDRATAEILGLPPDPRPGHGSSSGLSSPGPPCRPRPP
jgi:type VII secretion protein EccB